MGDYQKIPQRLHKYPASDRAKQIVHNSIAMDTLFSGVVPIQWTTPEAPEFHEVMDKVKAAGFKTIAGCPYLRMRRIPALATPSNRCNSI